MIFICLCVFNSTVFLMCFHLWQDVVNAICDDDDIRAISFVGSNTVSYSLQYPDFDSYLECV